MLRVSFIILQNVANATVPIDLEVGEDTEAFVQNTLNAFAEYYDRYVKENTTSVSISKIPICVNNANEWLSYLNNKYAYYIHRSHRLPAHSHPHRIKAPIHRSLMPSQSLRFRPRQASLSQSHKLALDQPLTNWITFCSPSVCTMPQSLEWRGPISQYDCKMQTQDVISSLLTSSDKLWMTS